MWVALRAIYNRNNPRDPMGEDQEPCFWCKMPDLHEDNAFAWKAFAIACSQLRVVGMGTAVGFEFSAIDRAMESVGVHPVEWDRVWHRVRRAGEAYAKSIRDREAQKERMRSAAKGTRLETKSAPDAPPMHTKPLPLPAFEV